MNSPTGLKPRFGRLATVTFAKIADLSATEIFYIILLIMVGSLAQSVITDFACLEYAQAGKLVGRLQI